MINQIKNIFSKNCFDAFIGKVYEDFSLSGIVANFYFTNLIVKIPNKKFIGFPNQTFRLLLYKVRLIKEKTETEVRIFDGEYVLILYKENKKIYVYYQWKYFINKVNDKFIEYKIRPTKKKLFYKGSYLDFIKKIYTISLELQKKIEKYGKITDAEYELEQQIHVLEKYIKKLEKLEV